MVTAGEGEEGACGGEIEGGGGVGWSERVEGMWGGTEVSSMQQTVWC